MKEVMIDIETLDVKTTAVILSIGLVRFSDYDPMEEGITLYPDMYEQLFQGRTIGQSTMEWWGKQELEARLDAFSSEKRQLSEQIGATMAKYCDGVEKFWCNGPHFDIAILESYLSHPYPWRYNQVMDMRTMKKECDPINPVPVPVPGTTAHRAVDDCKYQIEVLRLCRDRLIRVGEVAVPSRIIKE